MSNIRNKSKNKKAQPLEEISEEKIDQIMRDITLKRPRNPYTQFVLNEINVMKSKNKDLKINIQELSANLSEKWKKVKESEKKKYAKIYEEEKAKYTADLQLVSHYLFKDFNETVRRAPTAYRIFLNQKLIEGFDQGSDPKEVKKAAASEWAKMSDDERKVYINKKKENDNWFLKAEKMKKVSPIALFIQKKIQEAKEKHKEPPSLKEIAPAWKKLSKNEKKSYEKYAQDLNDEKEKLQDIYDIVHGVKPKRPAGAFRIFLQEKAKNNELKNLNDGHEMWNKLNEEEKEEYLTKSHRCLLAYRYKMMLYTRKIKKILPKRPKTALTQFLKEKKGQKPASGENWLSFWITVYNNLPKEKKKKYEEKAQKAKEIYERKMLQFQDKVFDMPLKPLSGFILYVQERLPDLKKEKPDEKNKDLLRQIAKEWQEEKDLDQSKYNKKAEKDKKRFKKQLAEFQKLGYYTRIKDTAEENDDDKKREKGKSMKKRSISKAGSQKTKKNRISMSKSKTQRIKVVSRSRGKKEQKVGKSQKSKK